MKRVNSLLSLSERSELWCTCFSTKTEVLFFLISPGAPPAPVRLSGQKIFEEKFSPFQWTGRWKFATNGGSWQHFYRRLNASKSARIESREDSKTHSVAEIGKNGVFFVKRARRFRNAGVLKTPESTRAPKMGESRTTTRKIKKNLKHSLYLSHVLLARER